MRKGIRHGCLAAAALLFCASALSAADLPLVFSLDSVYGGSSAPAAQAPWLEAAFVDRAPIQAGSLTINVVELSLTAKNLSGSEFIDSWFFNLDPAYTLPLTVEYQKPAVNPGPDALFSRKLDQLDANGTNGEGSGFDLLFDFFDENGLANAADLFGPNESVSFLIKGVNLFAASFGYTNNNGSFLSAALVRGIGPNSAFAWIADAQGDSPGPGPAPVPEPATMLLMGIGLGGMALVKKARRRR
jgi:hypothetical protein